jgi:putative DNA methylase
MDMVVELPTQAARGLAPFSLKDKPALIERVFPAQKVGIEAQKERKANVGQTLTSLGSYWKGRKPLVLVRACVLASLLPATDNPDEDLDLFESLMAMDDQGLSRRRPTIDAALVWASTNISQNEKDIHITGSARDTPKVKWRRIDVDNIADAAARREARERMQGERESLKARAFAALPFAAQVAICERVEKVESIDSTDDPLYRGIWDRVNAHLHTNARSIRGLVEQLGVARFGHRPVVGDPFCGGGSIPFESARIGCDVVATDLNPVAAMLTWGALNIIGGDADARTRFAEEQRCVAAAVETEIALLGIERNVRGDRAKAYLYCVEVVDPQTGWRVPMANSWIISTDRRCAARLVPDHKRKCFDIRVEEGLPASVMAEAAEGTVRDGHLVYRMAPIPGGEVIEWRMPVARLRGDDEGSVLPNGGRGNRLRPWDLCDVAPREPEWVADVPPVLPGGMPGAWVGGDIWLERLYCIQWLNGDELRAGRTRPSTRFTSPDSEDLDREARVLALVRERLADWQARGLVPDMRIEAGIETTRLMRERGWTHWHHLFSPRSLYILSVAMSEATMPAARISFARTLDFASRLSAWEGGAAKDLPGKVFSNQALNTWFNFGVRSSTFLARNFADNADSYPLAVDATVEATPSASGCSPVDLWVYDPPYADAVNYHEITEFFIAWLCKNPPPPFDAWTWDSRRPLAIQGKGEKFRADMVATFGAMANRMPDHGIQVCMFTHKDAGVWADMAQIVWGAGLQVTAAWYVSTETASDMKKGGYVQGTVLLVLRKRLGDERAYRDEIVPSVRARVQEQVRTLMGLNQRARGLRRDENPFSRADIQMAGYAAAMEVLTGVTHIDGLDMTREALRQRKNGEIGLVEEMIDLAVQTATELMVPTGIDEGIWERLIPTEHFYLTMAETEADRQPGHLGGKVDDYQNFAKAYRADGWEDLMADKTPNQARLKGAAEFRRALMTGHPFSSGILRPTLYAINELRLATEREEDPKTVADRILHGLRDHFEEWIRQRNTVREIAVWLGGMWSCNRPGEASAARMLAGIIQTERF